MDDANLQLKEIERLKKELREAENRLETIHKNAEDCEKSLKHLRQNPPLPEIFPFKIIFLLPFCCYSFIYSFELHFWIEMLCYCR